jgi:hypothetical protein
MPKILTTVLVLFLTFSRLAEGEDIIASYGGFGVSDYGIGFGESTYSVSEALDYNSDHITNVYFCKPESQFVCISGQHISFAVPKEISDFSQKWTFQGREFSFEEKIIRSVPDGVIKKRSYTWDLSDMGRNETVYVIARSEKKDDYERTIFFYSINSGLIGFVFKTDLGSAQHWLASEKGLGHDSLAQVIPKESYIAAKDDPAYQP